MQNFQDEFSFMEDPDFIAKMFKASLEAKDRRLAKEIKPASLDSEAKEVQREFVFSSPGLPEELQSAIRESLRNNRSDTRLTTEIHPLFSNHKSVFLSEGLERAIIKRIESKLGRSKIRSISIDLLRLLIEACQKVKEKVSNGFPFGVSLGYHTDPLLLEFSVTKIQEEESRGLTAVEVAIDLPMWGRSDSQEFVLRRLVSILKMGGVIVAGASLKTEILLKGRNRPVEVPLRSGNGRVAKKYVTRKEAEK